MYHSSRVLASISGFLNNLRTAGKENSSSVHSYRAATASGIFEFNNCIFEVPVVHTYTRTHTHTHSNRQTTVWFLRSCPVAAHSLLHARSNSTYFFFIFFFFIFSFSFSWLWRAGGMGGGGGGEEGALSWLLKATLKKKSLTDNRIWHIEKEM